MESGKPPVEEGYIALESDGLKVWVPEVMKFDDNTVRIEVRGFLWSKTLEVVNAKLPRGGCS
ncbi:hypothetical protein [Thermovirga sp.]|uniref:hypothetical protein n=1 Tax=Thermovirga sp. TaxID=2699834 RepID=UPI0025EEC0D2|nr:hypothetical protein [Thermovirga sp.]MBO8153751.1 hypothetical protein [Thermovirga sp.]